jgi:hypothetical protein
MTPALVGVGAAGLVFVGAIMWREVGQIEDEIRSAPRRTRADIDDILDRERTGGRYALLGNIAVIGGVALAGTSAYLHWRSRRESRIARVVPWLSTDGGGVVVTWRAP